MINSYELITLTKIILKSSEAFAYSLLLQSLIKFEMKLNAWKDRTYADLMYKLQSAKRSIGGLHMTSSKSLLC